MAARVPMGQAIRRLRRERGLTQSELAGRAGISTSYLNLIEHNRRPLTEPVGLSLARVMDLDPHELSSGEDARLLAALSETFRDPLFRSTAPPVADVAAMSQVPRSVQNAVLQLYRAYRAARDEARMLTERLASETLANAPAAELRGLVASIRSFGEILHDHVDLPEAERQRFLGMLVRDAEQLTELLDRLHGGDEANDASLGGKAAALAGLAGPGDASDFLEGRNNHFPLLEDAANSARRDILGDGAARTDAPIFEAVRQLLEQRHGIGIRVVPNEVAASEPHEFDASAQTLSLSEILPHDERAFQAVRRLALVSGGRFLDRCLEQAPPPAAELLDVCREALADYFARAVLMPYDGFRTSAAEFRYDIDRLARRFDVGVEQACHRLTTLRRPGASGIAFHLVRVDIAGNVTYRFNGSGLRIARYGGICPRWNIHSAFLSPGRTHAQLAETPDGAAWFCIARTVGQPAAAAHMPASVAAIGLGCDAAYAPQIVYADGLELDGGPRTPIGVNCRLCSRADCAQRVHRALDIALPDAAPGGAR